MAAMLFDLSGKLLGTGKADFPNHFMDDGRRHPSRYCLSCAGRRVEPAPGAWNSSPFEEALLVKLTHHVQHAVVFALLGLSATKCPQHVPNLNLRLLAPHKLHHLQFERGELCFEHMGNRGLVRLAFVRKKLRGRHSERVAHGPQVIYRERSLPSFYASQPATTYSCL